MTTRTQVEQFLLAQHAASLRDQAKYLRRQAQSNAVLRAMVLERQARAIDGGRTA